MEEIAVHFTPKGAFPLFLDDLEQDTAGWSLQDRYYYIRLLDHLYRAGGFIPNDNDFICEVIGLRKGRGYKDVLQKLRGKLADRERANRFANGFANAFARDFITRLVSETKGDWLTQKRILKEIAKSFQNYKKASAGGHAKAEKERASSRPVPLRQGLLPSPPTITVSKDTGAEAPDPVKELFDQGVAVLTRAGTAGKQARSIVGRLRGALGDAEARKVIETARTATDPASYLLGAAARGRREQHQAMEARERRVRVGTDEAAQEELAVYGVVVTK